MGGRVGNFLKRSTQVTTALACLPNTHSIHARKTAQVNESSPRTVLIFVLELLFVQSCAVLRFGSKSYVRIFLRFYPSSRLQEHIMWRWSNIKRHYTYVLVQISALQSCRYLEVPRGAPRPVPSSTRWVIVLDQWMASNDMLEHSSLTSQTIVMQCGPDTSKWLNVSMVEISYINVKAQGTVWTVTHLKSSADSS